MTRHETTQCKGRPGAEGCGKPIIWAAFTKEDGTPGKIPLDPRPACYEIVGTGGMPADGATARRAPNAFVTHFATCSKVVNFQASRPPSDVEEDLRKQLQKAHDEIAVLKEQVARARKAGGGGSLFDRPQS